MAEVKNAFLKAKMNKDFDDRLMPQGEYRDAVNIQVSTTESTDMGALQNVLGNKQVSDFGLDVTGLSSIGYLSDEASNTIYVFLTDNDGSYTANPNDYVPPGGGGSNHYIASYNVSSGLSSILVTGAFLNFHKDFPITGVNLLEDLLFWTDNRNQPRKVNVGQSGAYTSEDQISVAKYNPYESIRVYNESEVMPGAYETSMKDVSSKFNLNGGYGIVEGDFINQTNIDLSEHNIQNYPNEVSEGMTVHKVDSTGDVVNLTLNGVEIPNIELGVTPINGNNLTLPTNVDLLDKEELIFNANPYFINNYPGDPEINEDNFLRFSYRFKFDDGEHSIMAPFTQICFIPKQDGYFMVGDEEQAFSSSIVDFMQNKVNEVKLSIPLPVSGSSMKSDMHIKEIDILSSESDSSTVKVIETIPISDISSLDADVYEYTYKSQQPYKTLPTLDTTRVYDKIPVRALAQEIVSNRIVYGNYQDKHTPPSFINYNVAVNKKSEFNVHKLITNTMNSFTNTNDRIAILATSDEVDNILLGSSVLIYTGNNFQLPVQKRKIVKLEDNTGANSGISQFITLDQEITYEPFSDIIIEASEDAKATSSKEYPSSNVKSNRNYQAGIVLSDKFGRQSTVILSNSRDSVTIGNETFSGSTIYSEYPDEDVDINSWFGNSIKILFNEIIGPVQPNSNTKEPGIYNGDVTSPDYNPLGWYSYKVVIKQTEQEYYNVYTSGAMKGLPYDYDNDHIGNLSYNNSFIALINDNINKVPRDLSIVGPQDKTFRSSELLYGRVENTTSENKQFYPGKKSFVTTNIEDLYDMFDVGEFTGPYQSPIPITSPLNAFHGFYRSDSNPFIAYINTSQSINKQFGVPNSLTSTIVNGTCHGSPSNNVVTVSDVNTGEYILIGSILTSSVLPTTNEPYVVTGVEGTAPSDLTVTLNKPVSVSDGVALTFTFNSYNDISTLAIFETAPVESKLDIFWETSTSGKLDSLNDLIRTDSSGPEDIGGWNTTNFTENADDITTNYIGNASDVAFSITGVGGFYVLDGLDTTIPKAANSTTGVVIESLFLTSVETQDNTPVDVYNRTEPKFELQSSSVDDTYRIWAMKPSNPTSSDSWVYTAASATGKSYVFYFTIITKNLDTNETSTSYFTKYAALSNLNPEFTDSARNVIVPPTTFTKSTTEEGLVHNFYVNNGASYDINQPTLTFAGIYDGLSSSIVTYDSNGNVVTNGLDISTDDYEIAPPKPLTVKVYRPASFDTPGDYTARLTITDQGGATAVHNFNYELTDGTCQIYIPNVGGHWNYWNCDGVYQSAVFHAAGAEIYYNPSLGGVTKWDSGYNPPCFVSGSKVKVLDNGIFIDKPIELIKTGDKVLSIKNGAEDVGVVTETLEHEVNDTVIATKLDNGLIGEPNHPVLQNGKWVPLSNLGCCVDFYVDKYYNLEIDGDTEDSEHNYVVEGVVASGLGDNYHLNKKYQRQPKRLTSHLSNKNQY